MKFIEDYLNQTKSIIDLIDAEQISAIISLLTQVKATGGRLFIIGSGGGAGHASHATCDFRKLCDFEAYCPLDNISELTARINDDGWEDSITGYLRGSRLREDDCLIVFSVGGGCEENQISLNLVNAMKLAKQSGSAIIGVVGRDGGEAARLSDVCLTIPVVNEDLVTPHTEGFQALIWHLLVSHPDLRVHQAKWESTCQYV